jgi:hypothetical protein
LDDTSNWEFAAAVAAVSIGLGGLLLFVLVTALTHWRVLREAARAANDASRASVAVEDLAQQVQLWLGRDAEAAGRTSAELDALRQQAAALLEQQSRLQEAVRGLLDAGLLRSADAQARFADLEAALRRLDEHLNELAAAVANVTARTN